MKVNEVCHDEFESNVNEPPSHSRRMDLRHCWGFMTERQAAASKDPS